MEYYLNNAKELFVTYGIQIVTALIIFVIGIWVSKIIKNFLSKFMTKREVDKTIVDFVCNISYVALVTFVIIAALAQLGIQTTSFIAVIGAAGLAVGFALQGALANFAAGFILILFRPFKAGHFISGGGEMGTVEHVQILYTQLKTPDNITVVIPNSKLLGDNIINYSAKETRRAEWIVGVGYSDDLKKVRSVIKNIIESDERILKDPEPMIVVKELADSSVNFAVRAWVKTEDYWNVYFDFNETVKIRFDAEGINIPFPQRDVHLFHAS